MENQDKLEYVKLWHQQSGLLWGRLQTASVIGLASLAGWYKLMDEDHVDLARWTAFSSAMFLVVLTLIIFRDAAYLKAHEQKAGALFPTPTRPIAGISGRILAIIMVAILIIMNLILFLWGHQMLVT